MTTEIRHVINHNRFAWSLDDLFVPVIELGVLVYLGSRGYDDISEGTSTKEIIEGLLLFAASAAGLFFFFKRILQINSFVVFESPLDMEDNFLFCLDRAKLFNITEREFDKWNYCVGIRAHDDVNPFEFWLTMICYENKIYINERPAWYLLSLWWRRTGIDKMRKEITLFTSGGKEAAEKELENIRLNMEEYEQAKLRGDKKPTEDVWERNLVYDLSAPQFYSRQAVNSFSFFFSPLAGAILLTNNIKTSDAKWKVVAIGILCTAACGLVYTYISTSMIVIFYTNSLAAGVISKMLWNKYADRETKFRLKPITTPLLIALAITIPLIWLLFRGAGLNQ